MVNDRARVLVRFPLERNRSSDKESRQIETLERILIAEVGQLLRQFVLEAQLPPAARRAIVRS